MKSIIYIDRNNLYYYGGNVHTPIAYPFAKTAVVDMEIINEEELATQIADWIKTHKIEPSSTIILLSNTVYFQKEIPEGTSVDKQNEIKKMFVENVPFNETQLQEIPIGKSMLLIAINTEFVYAIRDIFQRCGFTLEAIAPIAEIYGKQPISAFSVQIAQDALKKITKANGFPLEHVEEIPISASDDPLPSKKTNNRLFLMIGVFVILIGILVIVYMTSHKPKTVAIEPDLPPLEAPVAPITESSSSATIPVSSSEATLSTKKIDLTIQVLNGSGVAGQADKIRQNLLDEGFDNITTGNAAGLESNKTLIIFKKEIGEKERSEIIKVIELFVDQYTVQERNDIDIDVLITTSPKTATPTSSP
ncbi:hypothetical protein BH09PAT2_BH09PAT2_05190 [soil metagenome]